MSTVIVEHDVTVLLESARPVCEIKDHGPADWSVSIRCNCGLSRRTIMLLCDLHCDTMWRLLVLPKISRKALCPTISCIWCGRVTFPKVYGVPV